MITSPNLSAQWGLPARGRTLLHEEEHLVRHSKLEHPQLCHLVSLRQGRHCPDFSLQKVPGQFPWPASPEARIWPRSIECSKALLLPSPREASGSLIPYTAWPQMPDRGYASQQSLSRLTAETHRGERTIDGGQPTGNYPSPGHQVPSHRTMNKTKSERRSWGLVTKGWTEDIGFIRGKSVSRAQSGFLVSIYDLQMPSSMRVGEWDYI